MVEHVFQVDIPPNKDKKEEREDYLFIKDAKGLFALSQFGVIEFHPWGCRVDKPERPDRMVFDLDPDEGLEWRDVVDAAHHIRGELAEVGLAAFVRTTGGKGLHLVVPVERRIGWPAFKDFSQSFVETLAKREPRRYTASVAKSARRGKIFVDYVRNARSARPPWGPTHCARAPARQPPHRSPGRNSQASTTPASSTTGPCLSGWHRWPPIRGRRLTKHPSVLPKTWCKN